MIIETNENKRHTFSSIRLGDVFKYENNYYLKTEMDNWNAVNLAVGTYSLFHGEDEVIPVKGKFVIE